MRGRGAKKRRKRVVDETNEVEEWRHKREAEAKSRWVLLTVPCAPDVFP